MKNRRFEAKKSRLHQLESRIYHLSSSHSGFTLIEMLVAIIILATLIGGVLLALNPIAQINKSQDAQRLADIQSIKTALDLYYSDNECYPTQIPFGNEWRVSNTIYMKKVPQDVRCKNSSSGVCYRYRTDEASSCPQWNVVFAQLTKESSQTDTCALSSLSSCTPEGYTDVPWACSMSGAVDCTHLSAESLIGGEETVDPTNTPTPLPSATPTPTQAPPAGSETFITLDSGTDPDAYEVTIMPRTAQIGEGQAIRVLARDESADITSVKVILYSDGDAREFTLNRVGGTARDGTWEGAWQVTDTYNQVEGKQYGFDITTTDAQGRIDVDYPRIEF